MEVLVRSLVDQAALGDGEARKELLDRLMGRPKQQVETLSVKATLEDYLKAISDEPLPIEPVIDIEPEAPENYL